MNGRDLILTLAVGAVAAAALTKGYSSTPYDAGFDRIGAARGVPPDLLRALARHESNFNPRAVNAMNDPGEGRDVGLMQVNERTARAMGRDLARLLEPAYSIETAAMLLVSLKRELGDLWSTQTWIAAYNAGSPAIRRRGVFNVAYTSAVLWHLQLYQLAGLVKGRA